MLVLRRKRGECIVIAGDIKLYVLDVVGERVAIGIKALPEVTIVREELLHAMDPDSARSPTPPTP